MRRARHGYTVVQHAGYLRAGDPQFIRGLQSAALTDEVQRANVQRLGGLVFDSYQQAEEWAYREQYPIDYHGLIPVAQGRFADERIDGLPIYIPPDG